MKCLVERAAGRVEPLGEDVDGDAVEGDGDEHLALVGGELGLDRVLQTAELLRGLGILLGGRAAVGEP